MIKKPAILLAGALALAFVSPAFAGATPEGGGAFATRLAFGLGAIGAAIFLVGGLAVLFRRFVWPSVMALAGLALLGLAGCNSNATISTAVTSDIQAALNVGCPILAAVQASSLKLSNAQHAAATTLALACPPNPPPTSAVVAAIDLVNAYTILQPLIK
jgi:hypothetical protein